MNAFFQESCHTNDLFEQGTCGGPTFRGICAIPRDAGLLANSFFERGSEVGPLRADAPRAPPTIIIIGAGLRINRGVNAGGKRSPTMRSGLLCSERLP